MRHTTDESGTSMHYKGYRAEEVEQIDEKKGQKCWPGYEKKGTLR